MSTAVNPLTAISTWSIDPAHSSVHFKVRHMMISKVRGDLRLNDADITQPEIVHPYARRAARRPPPPPGFPRHGAPSPAYLPVGQGRKAGVDALRVQGALTIHAVTTRSVELDVDSISPATKDPRGNVRMAASASTVISRKDFGARRRPLARDQSGRAHPLEDRRRLLPKVVHGEDCRNFYIHRTLQLLIVWSAKPAATACRRRSQT